MKTSRSRTNRRTALKRVRKTNITLQKDQEAVTATRRPLLKGLSVILASILGIGGTVAGRSSGKSKYHEEVSQATTDYQSPAAVIETLDNHAVDLMDELTGGNYLGSAKISDIEIDQVKVHESPAEIDADAGTYLTAFEKDGQFTAHISVVRKTPSKVIRINVRPQAGESFAIVKTRDGELVSVIGPNNDEISTKEICGSEGYTCPPSICCSSCGTFQVKYEEICCLLPSGTTDCYTQPTGRCCA